MSAWLLDRAGLSAATMKEVHGIAMDLWLLAIPVALITGWLFSVAFISAVSIYANFVGHFSGYEAARAEAEAGNGD